MSLQTFRLTNLIQFSLSKTAIASLSLLIPLLGFGNVANDSVAAFPLNSAQLVASDERICAVNLAQQIDRLLANPDLASAHWGIIIQNLQTQEILYQHNADQLFIPASNLKLLTTAAALLTFGENYQIKTPFLAQGQAPNLQKLTLIAQGDPTLTSEKLTAIAIQLKNQGIKQIQKLELVDDLAPENWLNGTWEWEDIHSDYAAPINRAILNQNTVNLTIKATNLNKPAEIIWSDELASKQWQIINQTKVVSGETTQPIQIRGLFAENKLVITGELKLGTEESNGIAIPNPSLYFLQSLEQALTAQGIQIIAKEITQSPPFLRGAGGDKNLVEAVNSPLFSTGAGGDKTLIAITSPPLSEIIKTTNQDSNNFYAEALLSLLKSQANLNPDPVKTALKKSELNLDLSLLKDGSGLSRQNLISPHLFTQLLVKLASNQSYRNSLAIAGETGTLKNRFLNTALAGKLQAKTGTLSGISGLSGYFSAADSQPLTFSILVNNANLPSPILRATSDQILLWAEQVTPCISSLSRIQ